MSEEKKKPAPLKRAWASGVFDARMTVPDTGYVLRFESTDKSLMTRFFEVVGIGQLDVREKKECAHEIHVFRTINMNDTRDLILVVAPFLSGTKLAQASRMLGRIERSPIWQKKNPEKVASLVTAPAENVQAQTPPHTTQADG